MNALRLRISSLWPALLRSGRIGEPLRVFARAERGAAAMFFALSSPVWLGGLALGAEVGSWYYFQQKLQATADAVALSVAARVGTGPSQAELDNLANDFLTRNQFNFSQGTWEVTLSEPPRESVFADGSTVNVELTRSVRRLLSGIFERGDFVVRANAAAQVHKATEGCILALGLTPSQGLQLLSANVQVTGCEVLSNGNMISVWSDSRLVTDCARSAAFFNIQGALSVSCRNGQPVSHAGFTLDPYFDLLDLDLSLVGGCSTVGSVNIRSDSDWGLINPTVLNGRQYAYMCPGRNLSIQGTGTGFITVPDWTFIFDGSSFSVSNTNLTGLNVSFYFANGGRAVIFAPSQRIILTSNDAHGMLFRGAKTNSGVSNNQIVVGAGSALQGAIYFPASEVFFQTSGFINGCPQIIGRTVSLLGTWQLAGPCRAPGVRPIVASRSVDLTQ